MSGKIIHMPEGFVQTNPNAYLCRGDNGDLLIVLAQAFCDKHYDYDVSLRMYMSLEPDSRDIIASRHSIPEAVSAVNAKLKRLGIDVQYDISNLPTERTYSRNGVYTSAWVAIHMVTDEQLPKLQRYLWWNQHPFQQDATVAQEMAALERSGRRLLEGMPTTKEFPSTLTGSKLHAMWTTDSDHLHGDDIVLLFIMRGGYLTYPKCLRVELRDGFITMKLRVVVPGDIIVDAHSFDNAKVEGRNIMIPVYRVKTTMQDKVVCDLTYVHLGRFPKHMIGWY